MPIPDGVPIITADAERRLNDRQLIDYRLHRETMLEWLAVFGKYPREAEGYSESTLQKTGYRIDAFYRWVWDQEGYTLNIGHKHADDYLHVLAAGDKSYAHKSNTVASIKRLFKWKKHEKGGELWDPPFTFSSSASASQPRDYLTRDERSKIREAALEYGTIPAYSDLTPQERSEWKIYLAQRLEKPKEDVIPKTGNGSMDGRSHRLYGHRWTLD